MMSNIEAYRKYTAPKTVGSYFKLEDGESAKIRIASDCYVYMDAYQGQKPSPKYAWVIWNFNEQRPQVLQASVRVFETIQGYILDEEWGDPTEYSLTIKRDGVEKLTKYIITPSPNKATLSSLLNTDELEKLATFDIRETLKDKELISLAEAADGAEAPLPGQAASGDTVITDLDTSQNVNLDDIPF